jgi:tRNA pseudouridine38-40 synthase
VRFEPDRLCRALHVLEGEADFSAFRAAGSSSRTLVCRVLRAGLRACGDTVQFDIVADHFLYHMVRTLMGTALAVANAPDPAAAMAAVIDSRDRRSAGPTVPARGLCLEEVFYPPEAAA